MSAASLHVSERAARVHDEDLLLLDAVRIHGWERLLFLECGDGWVAEEGWRRMGKGYVCGLDRSLRRVAIAARLRGVPGKLEFMHWDGQTVPHPDRWFDAVVLRRDVRRWARPAAVLREAGRVTRPGGDVYCVEAAGPMRAGTPEWPRLLGDAGFVLQDVRAAGAGRMARVLRAREPLTPP